MNRALPSARINGLRFNGSGGAYPAPLSQAGSPGMTLPYTCAIIA